MNQLIINIILKDELLMLLLLSSSPNSWETLPISLNSYAPSGKYYKKARFIDDLYMLKTEKFHQ